MHPMRTLLRRAQRLQAVWHRRVPLHGVHGTPWRYLTEAWLNLQTTHRRMQMAGGRGFVHCLAGLREDYRGCLDELSRTLAPLREFRGTPDRTPGLSDWVHELRTLEDEFGGVAFDEKRSVLRVTTEPIVLEGVDLGPFAIEFDWTRLGQLRGSSCFELVALDPRPATGRNEVTHPHVSDGGLCAGDAAMPMDRALDDGRISDAFVLIRSVLTTYNARSAYVPLAEWDGLICGDCGDRTDRECNRYCPGCESDLCDGCSSSCRSCEETRCGGCLTPCDGCGDFCCSGCLERSASGESICSACRDTSNGCHSAMRQTQLHDEGLCASCAEASDAVVTPDTSETSTTPILVNTHVS